MKRFFLFLFPLTLLAFQGSSIQYLAVIFTLQTRWIFLAILILITLFFKLKTTRLPDYLLLSIAAYLFWCLLTVFWSSGYKLAFVKSILLIAVVFTMMYAGKCWIIIKGKNNFFNYLAPIAFFSIIAAALGYFFNHSAFSGILYRGFIYGSNMLGFLIAVSDIFILWQLSINWRISNKRFFWLTVFAVTTVFLIMSISRAAILIVLFTLSGLIFSFSLSKKTKIIFTSLSIFLIILVIIPELRLKIVKKIMYKEREFKDVFVSRRVSWKESWKMAKLGGLIGQGYGVTVGADEWNGSAGAPDNDREKGNSQLAVVEETGLLGLILYLSLVVSLIGYSFSSFKKAKDKQIKIALGLSMGAILGFLVHSCFESWWSSPGSPEAVIFWSLVGGVWGLSNFDLYVEYSEVKST